MRKPEIWAIMVSGCTEKIRDFAGKIGRFAGIGCMTENRKRTDRMFYRYTLSNGIEVISEPMANRKTVAIGVFVKVGSQNETRENNGISHLIEHMLFKGTKKHSAKEIADITARMGDDVNAFTSKECTALYGMTITEKLEELAELLGDMLTDSLFDEKELVKEKRIVMDEIDMYEDSAEDLVHELLQKRVWRDDPLGFLISGTKSVVRTFHSRQLHFFHKEHYFAENMLISVAGGYEEEKLHSWLEKAFARVRRRQDVQGCGTDAADRRQDMQECGTDAAQGEAASCGGQRKSGALSPAEVAAFVKREKAKELTLPPYHREYEKAENPAAKGTVKEKRAQGEPSAPQYYRSFASADKDIEQLHMNLAFPALCVDDERRFAYSIMNSAFGGSNNSRLFQKIREEAGMAYSVYSYSSAYNRAGLFHIDITVQPQLAVPVFHKVAEIVREFVRDGMTPEELSLHRQQVGTELIMSSESPKTRMDSNAKFALAGAELYTLEEKLACIESVTCEQIQSLAAEILKLSDCSLCVVGDKSCTDLRGLKRLWEGIKE